MPKQVGVQAPGTGCRIGALECIAGLLIASLILYLHWVNLRHAGGLWRDEAGSANLAQMTSLRDVWDCHRFEAFPMLFSCVLRFWAAIGFGGTDLGLRVFGCLMGICVLAALWFSGRLMGVAFPFASFVVFGMNPLVIRIGDSVRAYGLGMALILLAMGLMWKVVEQPNPKRILLATVISLLSVQSLYQNAFLLAGICAAGIVVTCSKGLWRRSVLIFGIGMLSALSLIAHISIIRQASEWKAVVQLPVGPAGQMQRWVWQTLLRILGEPSGLMPYVWFGLFCAGLAAAGLHLMRRADTWNTSRDRTLYCVTVLLFSMSAFWPFMAIVNMTPQVWHYCPFLALAAVSLDAILVPHSDGKSARTARAVLGFSLAGFLFFPALRGVQVRQTNIDLIARHLHKVVSKEDLILVNPWYCGATFQRYYRGKAKWLSVPPIADHKLHRLDLLKRQLGSANPLAPVLDRMGKTLASGHRVWIVGGLSFPKEGRMPPQLPPAPLGPDGWYSDPYLSVWALQIGYFASTRARSVAVLSPLQESPVNPLEDAAVILAEGWRS